MIENSFIFLDKIGPRSEQKIWYHGINNWDEFLNAKSIRGFSQARKLLYNMQISKALKNLKAGNIDFLSH